MPTKVTKVACQSCGADLSIDESIRFVTCGYCSAQLEIVHDPTTVHSKVLEEVVKRQDAVEDKLNILRLERKLQKLDREWGNFRDKVCTKGPNGALLEPSKFGEKLSGYIIAAVGIMMLIGSLADGFQPIVLVLGLIAIWISVAVIRKGGQKADEFATMRSRYLATRTQLKGKLSSAERKLRFNPIKQSGRK